MAATYGARVACRARAAVALDNVASLQAFRRAGFRPRPDVCKLLISRTRGLSPSLSIEPSVTIRQATSIREVDGLFAGELPDRSPPDLSLLLAEQKGQVVGYVELVDVETLLYRGTWIESLKAPAQQIRQALVRQAVNQTRAAGLDEIGAMVPERNWPWQQALIASGFRSLGDFRWLVAESRLSGLVEQDRV
jgi:L-amino acid N-acyltransferase YncA